MRQGRSFLLLTLSHLHTPHTQLYIRTPWALVHTQISGPWVLEQMWMRQVSDNLQSVSAQRSPRPTVYVLLCDSQVVSKVSKAIGLKEKFKMTSFLEMVSMRVFSWLLLLLQLEENVVFVLYEEYCRIKWRKSITSTKLFYFKDTFGSSPLEVITKVKLFFFYSAIFRNTVEAATWIEIQESTKSESSLHLILLTHPTVYLLLYWGLGKYIQMPLRDFVQTPEKSYQNCI